MTEILERPDKVLGPAMGRSRPEQDAYEWHAQDKLERGDDSCDMCRLVQEQKLGKGTLEITSKELEIVAKELERVSGYVSIVINGFRYRMYDGQEVKRHLLLVPDEHYAKLIDLPPDVKAAYDHILPFAMDAVDLSATRSPKNGGSSIKGHLHTHLYELEPDRVVEELHYSRRDNVNLVRFQGDETLTDM
jgi:hypothetical protein